LPMVPVTPYKSAQSLKKAMMLRSGLAWTPSS
jgi:hypothetical protein